MDRRRFLEATTLPLLVGAAGCASSSSSTESQDTDGDGIPDAEDYAPRDPDVQVKADVKETTRPTTRTSPTTTTTTTTSTTTAPTTTAPAKPIQANYEPIQDGAVTYFKAYSLRESTLELHRSGFDDGELQDRMRVTVTAQEYPDGDILAVSTSDPLRIEDGTNEIELAYDLDVRTNEHFYLNAFASPPNKSFRQASADGTVVFLTETDRLQLVNGQLRKDEHPDAKDTLEKPGYKRTNGEGLYTIEISGDVEFGLTVYKHGYLTSNQKALQSAKQTVFDSYERGLSKSLASIVSSAAENAGASAAREKVSYAVSVIQQLPYVKDTVDDSYNDYNKYPIETLVEAGGDCEDTVILLAATLLAKPFNYGMILIYLPYESPTHIGLGIRGSENVTGSYYTYDGERYFYQETTGEGWRLGEVPEAYTDESAKLIPLF